MPRSTRERSVIGLMSRARAIAMNSATSTRRSRDSIRWIQLGGTLSLRASSRWETRACRRAVAMAEAIARCRLGYFILAPSDFPKRRFNYRITGFDTKLVAVIASGMKTRAERSGLPCKAQEGVDS